MSNVVELLYLCRQVSVLVLIFCFEEKFFRVFVQAEKSGPNQQQQGQVVDLMALPMTPEAMELRASPKAPRLTLLMGGGVGGD